MEANNQIAFDKQQSGSPTPLGTSFRQLRENERSYPLVSIFQLFTSCIALAVCINGIELQRTVFRLQDQWLDVVFAILLAGAMGLLVGVLFGLGQLRRWRSALFCGIVGMAVGIFVLATCVAPARIPQASAACLLPLITIILLRFRSD